MIKKTTLALILSSVAFAASMFAICNSYKKPCHKKSKFHHEKCMKKSFDRQNKMALKEGRFGYEKAKGERPSAEEMFKKIDSDNNGSISQEEFNKHIEAKKAKRLERKAKRLNQ